MWEAVAIIMSSLAAGYFCYRAGRCQGYVDYLKAMRKATNEMQDRIPADHFQSILRYNLALLEEEKPQ